MSKTTFPVNDALTVKLWAKKLTAEGLKQAAAELERAIDELNRAFDERQRVITDFKPDDSPGQPMFS